MAEKYTQSFDRDNNVQSVTLASARINTVALERVGDDRGGKAGVNLAAKHLQACADEHKRGFQCGLPSHRTADVETAADFALGGAVSCLSDVVQQRCSLRRGDVGHSQVVEEGCTEAGGAGG